MPRVSSRCAGRVLIYIKHQNIREDKQAIFVQPVVAVTVVGSIPGATQWVRHGVRQRFSIQRIETLAARETVEIYTGLTDATDSRRSAWAGVSNGQMPMVAQVSWLHNCHIV
jgi:hypothetical protein